MTIFSVIKYISYSEYPELRFIILMVKASDYIRDAQKSLKFEQRIFLFFNKIFLNIVL